MFNISNLIESLQSRRYPTLLLIEQQDTSLEKPYKEDIAKQNHLHFVDFITDVLLSPQNNIILGAYSRGEFVEWLVDQSRNHGGLFVDNADSLISTWLNSDRMAFFKDFQHIECNVHGPTNKRAPVVLLSRLAVGIIQPTNSEGGGIVYIVEKENLE